MDRKRQAVIFRYPLAYRLGFGVAGSFFAVLTAWLLTAGPVTVKGGGPGWPSVCFGIFAVASLIAFWLLLARIEIDDHKLARRRLWQSCELPWESISQIQHRAASGRMVIIAGGRTVAVHRQLCRFLDFDEWLRNKAPAHALEPLLDVPFTVHASWNMPIAFTVLPAALIAFAIYGSLTDAEPGALLLLVGAAAATIGIGLRETILRYEFTAEELRLVYPLRTRRFSWTHLESAVIVQGLDIAMVLNFDGTAIVLSDNQIVVAPERIFYSLNPLFQRNALT